MFALMIGSTAGFLAVLILIGAYSATRNAGGSDYFRSDAVKLTAVVVVALLSALPTDVFSVIWLTLLQYHVDATANLFLLVVAPMVAAIVAVQALVLSRAYRQRPVLFAAVYLGIYAVTHAFWLARLFNPPADIAGHAAVILIVGSLVMAFVARFVWRRSV